MLEDDIRGYHDHHFRFSDMVVAAAGQRRSTTHLRELLLARARRATGRAPTSCAPTRSWPSPPRRAFFTKETEQMHVCLGGEGLASERRAPLPALGARQPARRVAQLAALPGGAREAWARLQHLLVLEHVSRDRACAASTSGAGPIGWVRSPRSWRPSCVACAASRCRPTSSSGPRSTSRDVSSSDSRARPAA